MTVVDASLVADALRATGGPSYQALKQAALPIAAPELIDLEVASAYRKLVASGQLSAADGQELLRRLASLPLDRHRHAPLLKRVWELRGAMAAYDAAYVALAERLGAVLMTRDGKLARAGRARCQITLVT